MSPYEKCPVFENENYLIRFVQMTDASDLYLVYSDEKAVPIFNSDNCTNEFYCKTVKQMQQMIEFWQREYQNKYYVRWTIWDKAISQAVGTIELFNRKYYSASVEDKKKIEEEFRNIYPQIQTSIKNHILEYLSSAGKLFAFTVICIQITTCCLRIAKAV